ncbi:MAG TPA: rod shape-determining protein MreC [Tissierellaceae bacterium]|nr:rod shape-determining protein MreC [Tissierellaceae bacterium]
MYFFKKYKNRMIVAIVTIILFVIIGRTGENRTDISQSEKIVMNSLGPVNGITSSIRVKVSNIFSTLKNLTSILDENKNLKNEISKLEEENRDLENIIGKSDFLKEEMELLEKTNLNLLSSKVTSKESGNWYNTFNIDKGSNDGVEKGNTVVQGLKIKNGSIKEGVVGRVSEVSENSAKVVSIIDESNNIAFKSTRTQDGGVISGNVDNSLSGYLFDNKADIKEGDKLYTSGLGDLFKEDIYIGEVEKVTEAEKELMKRITIKPAIDFKKIYKVLVVLE